MREEEVGLAFYLSASPIEPAQPRSQTPQPAIPPRHESAILYSPEKSLPMPCKVINFPYIIPRASL
jgi:hypothetical protein